MLQIVNESRGGAFGRLLYLLQATFILENRFIDFGRQTGSIDLRASFEGAILHDSQSETRSRRHHRAGRGDG